MNKDHYSSTKVVLWYKPAEFLIDITYCTAMLLEYSKDESETL